MLNENLVLPGPEVGLMIIAVIIALSLIPVAVEILRSQRSTSQRGGGGGPSTGP